MMTQSTQKNLDDELKVPMFSWWQTFLLTFFDVDFNRSEWKPSSDLEVREMNVMVTKYSWLQMIKMTLLQTDE